MSLDSAPFPLWSDCAPGALGTSATDIPTLTPYLPAPGTANGASVVICPGGGYVNLAAHEGEGYALWFAAQGITAFVLKYRLGSSGYRAPIMLWDAARAVRTVRAWATEWRLDPTRIAIIGSSAGGHLASTLLTQHDPGNPTATDPIDRVSSRPDLGILCYPVITMGEKTHAGSRQALLGTNPPQEQLDLYSGEKQVTSDTPPCFIFHTWEDGAVDVANAIAFAGALQTAGVPFDFHVYTYGHHGIGLGKHHSDAAALHPWSQACRYWLEARQFFTPKASPAS